MTDFSSRRVTMVDTQVRPSDVTKFPIIEAMLAVRRESFVPSAQSEAAYIGADVELSRGRVVLEPRTIAKMLDALDIQPHDLVLDIGCGLGYTAALIARMADAVIALEEDEQLAGQAESRLTAEGAHNAVVIGGRLAEGAAKHGPYDVIIIEGAAEVVPEAVIAQIKEGGRIACIFAEGALGICRVGVKTDGMVAWRFAFNATAPILPGYARVAGFEL